jgi:hypothetical protein
MSSNSPPPAPPTSSAPLGLAGSTPQLMAATAGENSSKSFCILVTRWDNEHRVWLPENARLVLSALKWIEYGFSVGGRHFVFQ